MSKKDKDASSSNVEEFFVEKVLDRRVKNGVVSHIQLSQQQQQRTSDI